MHVNVPGDAILPGDLNTFARLREHGPNIEAALHCTSVTVTGVACAHMADTREPVSEHTLLAYDGVSMTG